MLNKKEEKKEKVKDEPYYALNHEELRLKTKNLSLVTKDMEENDDIYQIWSSKSDDEDMCYLMHGAIFAKNYREGSDEEFVTEKIDSDSEVWSVDGENIEVRCFMATTSKFPMTEKVHDLLISFNMSSNSYNST